MFTSKVIVKYAIMKLVKSLLLAQLALLGVAIPVAILSRRASPVVPVDTVKMHDDSNEHGITATMSSFYAWMGNTNDTQVTIETSSFGAAIWDSVVSFSNFKTLVYTFAWNHIYSSFLAWGRTAEAVMEGFNSFLQWMARLFKSYDQLKDEALNRYTELNDEVEALTIEHQQLVQMCLHPADQDTRTKCIDSFLVIHDCLTPLRRQRRRAHNQFLQYEKYAEQSKIMKQKAQVVEI